MKRVLGSPFGTSGALGRTLCSRLSKCSRKRLRISFPVIRGFVSLWRESFEPPTAAGSVRIADAVVQAVLAILPELDPARAQRKAAPLARQRHIVGISEPELQHLLLEHGARRQDAA